ncbi:MAG: hypothetical protein JWQ03_2211 [Variovorax sp.]|nr:hypothetical protein [Variovorax sp.]
MPLSYLSELATQPMPVRVTDPARLRLLHRLHATGQLVVRFHGDNDSRYAEVMEITPLGSKILRCVSTRNGLSPMPPATPTVPDWTA